MSEGNYGPGASVPTTGRYECVCCGRDGLAGIMATMMPGDTSLGRLASCSKAVEYFSEGDTFPSCPNLVSYLPSRTDLTGWGLLSAGSSYAPPVSPPAAPPPKPESVEERPRKKGRAKESPLLAVPGLKHTNVICAACKSKVRIPRPLLDQLLQCPNCQEEFLAVV